MSSDPGSRPDLIGLVGEERRDLANFLDTLTPAQWQAPSLCVGWSVLDVVAHLISFEGLGPAGLLRRRVQGIGRGGPIEVGRAKYATHSPS